MESQCFIAETPTEPPPKQRVAAPVASRGGDDKQITTVHTKPYTPISLLDKWRLLQAIITDPRLSPTAKVVAGALLDCLNWQTGRCYPSLAHLAKRVGKKRGVISAAICRLIECGWLFRPRRRGASSYRFAFVCKKMCRKMETVALTTCRARLDVAPPESGLVH
jgi:hypothetical protein